MKLCYVLLAGLLSVCSAMPLTSFDNVTDSLEAKRGFPCDTRLYLSKGAGSLDPGNGDPHQNYYDIQLSDTITCNAGSCSAGETETESTTIGFTIGTNSNFKPTFWQGGFAVTHSWTTGNTYTCNAEAGQRVCIWQRVAHTAVSFRFMEGLCHLCLSICAYPRKQYSVYRNDCDGTGAKHAIMRSPNQNNEGGGFYCARDDKCQNKGANHWQIGDCQGGPQPFCGAPA